MRVRDLLRVLGAAPPDAVVLVTRPDHAYTEAWAELTTARYDANGYTEDHGEEYADGAIEVPAVVIT